MQNYDFYVWSTTDGDTTVYSSISDLVDGESPFSANLNEDVVEIGVLIPTSDQRFKCTHDHVFVKIRILKDTHFNQKGEIQYVEADSSNLQSPKEVVDYLSDDEYEILQSFYGIPFIILNYASPYVDDEDFFDEAIEDIKKMDLENIIRNRIKEFEGLGIQLSQN